jgi:hypothetical protein
MSMQYQLLIAVLAVVCYVLYLGYIVSREHRKAHKMLEAPLPDAAIERLEADLAKLDCRVGMLDEKIKALNKEIAILECGVPSRSSGGSGSSQRESKQPFSM